VQAASKNAISKTRTPVGATCLITNRTYVQGVSDATSRKRLRSQTAATVSTMDGPIQKPECAELIPVSPPGANDGREKWAEVLVIPDWDAFSVTVPS